MEHLCNGTDWGKPKYPEKKPVPVPLCTPQIPHGLAWVWTWTCVVTGQQLTAWAIVCTTFKLCYFCSFLKCTHVTLSCFLLICFPRIDLQILSIFLFLILLPFFLLSYLYFRIICVSYGMMTFVLYVLNITFQLLLVLKSILTWRTFALHVNSAQESDHNSVEEV